jgi:hypothetical protein
MTSIDKFIEKYKHTITKNRNKLEEYINGFSILKKSDKVKLSSFVTGKLWKDTKYKVKSQNELNVLEFYLDNIYKLNFNEINIKNQFSIEVYDNKLNDTIRGENIFKLDMNNIIKELCKKYKNIKMMLKFEEATSTQLKFLEKQHVFHHDTIIEITNNKNIESLPYVIALEYLEKGSHSSTKDKVYDNEKKIISELMCDSYLEYREGIDNYEDFIEKVTFELIKYTCALNNDETELCKYICAIKNSIDKEIFNKMLTIKKNNKFDKKKFYIDIEPENEEIQSEEDFYNKLEEEYNIDTTKANYETFEKIIIMTDPDKNESIDLIIYKKMLGIMFNGLLNASHMIIELIKKERNKRINIPDLVLHYSKNFCYNEETKKLKSK